MLKKKPRVISQLKGIKSDLQMLVIEIEKFGEY